MYFFVKKLSDETPEIIKNRVLKADVVKKIDLKKSFISI